VPAIVEHPTVVQDAVSRFGHLFPNEPERRHFAKYLTGLFVAEKKNVSGINSEFAARGSGPSAERTFRVTTDQSCLNRWLNDGPWDPKALNDERLQWLQKDPSTRYSAQGVIAVDLSAARQATRSSTTTASSSKTWATSGITPTNDT
jgi:hypothetical protein